MLCEPRPLDYLWMCSRVKEAETSVNVRVHALKLYVCVCVPLRLCMPSACALRSMCIWPVAVRSQTGEGGGVAQLVERAPLTQVRFLGAAKDFSPVVQFQCRLSYGVRTTPCAIACIDICAHGKHPAVHVTVRWIMKTLKHPACTVGRVVRLFRSWLSSRKAAQISQGRNCNGTIQLLKKCCEMQHVT